MTVRQCLSSFGAEHRCVLQEHHKAWHTDYRGTIWSNAEPGDREWLTPPDAARHNEIHAAELAAQAAAAEAEADRKKLEAARKIAGECLVVYGVRKKPERAQGSAAEKRRRETIRAALWMLTPDEMRRVADTRVAPERQAKTSDRWKSHHLLHPGAWMMQGLPETWAADYDALNAAVHEDLVAAGIV